MAAAPVNSPPSAILVPSVFWETAETVYGYRGAVFSNVDSADRLSRVTSQEKVLQKWLPLWSNSENTPQSSLIRATLTVRKLSFVKEFAFPVCLFGKSLLWYTFFRFYISAISQYKPTDATTNPSLLLAASKLPQYQNLFDKAVQYGKANGR